MGAATHESHLHRSDHRPTTFFLIDRAVLVGIDSVEHLLHGADRFFPIDLSVVVGVQPFEEIRRAGRTSAPFLGRVGPRSQGQDQSPGKECDPDSHSSLLSSVLRGTLACLPPW
jgi:hypothetical protein